MTVSLPKIDMSQIQEVDLLQEYYLLFKHMCKDFLTIEDFILIMTQAMAIPPLASPGNIILTNPVPTMALVKLAAYTALAKTGGAIRKLTITGLEAITAEK